MLSKTSRKLLACVIIAFAALLAAPELSARDHVEYGRYLGVRLRMYDESFEVLDKAIKTGSDAEKSRAKRAKATVIKSQADFLYSADKNESDRSARYMKAIEVFGNPTSAEGVAAKSTMMVEVCRSLARKNPIKARTLLGEAETMLKAEIERIGTVRNKSEADFEEIYAQYSIIYYRYCELFYVRGLTYAEGSSDRENELKRCELQLQELQFELTKVTEELVKSFMLEGEIAEARGDLMGAVAKYQSLVSFVSGLGDNAFIGRLALSLGYLRAVPILVEKLGYEPERLQQVIKLYSEAKAKFGEFRSLASYFKRFELYQISAMVKLGDKARLKGAIAALFRLANDTNHRFRSRALSVLADIASSDSLDRETRFKCVQLADMGRRNGNPLAVNLKVANAFQSILVSLGTVESFETYGPACYAAIGGIYEDSWRFYDAAITYREASLRTRYFRNKYENLEEGGDVPAHMKDRTAKIMTGKDVYDFTKIMADGFSKCAGFLVNETIGDPNNRVYVKLAGEAKQFQAVVGDAEAIFNLTYGKARDHFNSKKYATAAALYLNMPASYRKYYLGLYNAANAYRKLAEIRNVKAMNTRGASDEEKESLEFYEAQEARLASDMPELQQSLFAGINADHWTDTKKADIDGQLANWHKALFCLKKYALFDAHREWESVKEAIAANPNADYIDAIQAVADARNARWAKKNPTGKGAPDNEMIRLGRSVYQMAFMMRRPPKNLPVKVQDELKAKYLGQALRLLRPFWAMFGTHMANDEAYKRGALKFAFYALAETNDISGSEDAYLAFSKAYPDDNSELKNMVATMYQLMVSISAPEARALINTGSALRARSRSIKKGMYSRINAEKFPAWAKKLETAKGELAKQEVLADHFWDVWVKQPIFGEATKATEESKAKKAFSDKYYADVMPELNKWWEASGSKYKKRWGDNIRAEFNKSIKKKVYDPIRDAANKAANRETDNGKLIDVLRALPDTLKGKNKTLSQTLVAVIETATMQDRYFLGTIFVYDFAEFMEAKAVEMYERARPITSSILRYFQLHRSLGSGGAKVNLSEGDLIRLSGQYFRIRDWENTILYWQDFVTRFGGTGRWGKIESISYAKAQKVVGHDNSNEELMVKYQLGKAYLERFKADGDPEDLKKAALLMRRCYNYNLIRDVIEIAKLSKVNMRFKYSMEQYYLAIGADMAEIYGLLHKSSLNMNWPKYKDQYNRELKGKELQWSPNSKPEFLYAAIGIHQGVWLSFRQLDAYQYRTEFRSNYIAWLGLMVSWKSAYGVKDKDIEEIKKAGGAGKWIEEAKMSGEVEQQFDASTLNETTKAYISEIKALTKKLK